MKTLKTFIKENLTKQGTYLSAAQNNKYSNYDTSKQTGFSYHISNKFNSEFEAGQKLNDEDNVRDNILNQGDVLLISLDGKEVEVTFMNKNEDNSLAVKLNDDVIVIDQSKVIKVNNKK